ncbi:MAG: sugar phosphate isomerase/epimerase [Firmicutes bacterium]|nr:sugar phosphate isomerase/epimerase [Bacillota bacterium]
MLFGVTTMTFFHQPILQALETIKASGLDYAEIWADHAWDEVKGASAEELKEALVKLGLKSTIHCPIMDLNITSPNRGIREESLRQTRQAIDLARDLGSRLIVIHPGSKYSRLEDSQAHWEIQVDSMAKLLAYAKEQGVLAAVENMDSDKEVVSVKHWADLNRLFEDLGSAEKWVTLDITHIRETEQVLAFIQEAGPHIAHVHLSDGTLEKMHLPIGQGNLDLPRIAAALKAEGYLGVWSLECFIANNNPVRMKAELQQARALFQQKE